MDDLVIRHVAVAGREVALEVPRDSEALLAEEAFEREDLLPYWAELWPSGVALAEAVAASGVTGRVLELGCGLGLPSLTAALGGAQVTATDWSAEAIRLLKRNAARAGTSLDARRWSWTGDVAALPAPYDLVLAADVLYEPRDRPRLLAAIGALTAEAWIADPGRPGCEQFFAAASADGWVVDAIAPRVHRLRSATKVP